MPNRRDDRPTLSESESRLVDGFRTHYAPPPMTGARRTAFDARLRERLEGAGTSRSWLPSIGVPSAALAGAVAALLWASFPGSRSDPEEGTGATRTAQVETDTAWESAILYSELETAALEDTLVDAEEAAALPPEYAAIHSVFFEDDDLLGG